MKRRLSAVEARKRLGEVLEGVFYRGDEVVIERAGKPMAVMIPAAVYEQMQSNRKRLIEMIEKNWEKNKDVPIEEIERDIAETIAEIRADASKPQSRIEPAKG